MANELQAQLVKLFLPFFGTERERRDFIVGCWSGDLLPTLIDSSGNPRGFAERFVYEVVRVRQQKQKPYLEDALHYLRDLVGGETQQEIDGILAVLVDDADALRGFTLPERDAAYQAPPLPAADVLVEPGPLPPGSYLPHERNGLFTGRENELKELARLLLYEPGGGDVVVTQTAVASGLGGIGKTQLAVEFGYRYGRYFPGGVYWLNMEKAENVAAEIALLGGVGGMGLHPEFETLAPEVQKRLMMQAWQEPIGRLLIFDNCEVEAVLAEWRPPSGGCRVLVTSRRGEWDVALGVALLPLPVLARGESVALLRRFVPELEPEAADEIAAELGDLPLALHVAGSFLKRYGRRVTAADYLAQLRSQAVLDHASMMGRGATVSPTDHDLHVARTFKVSYDRLDRGDEVDGMALALLVRAACLAPGEPIPCELLLGMVAPVDDTGDGAMLLGEDGLTRLVALGFLEREAAETVTLHRLLAVYVQAVIAGEMGQTREQVEVYIVRQVYELNKAGYPAPLLVWQTHLRHVAEQAAERESERAGRLLNSVGYHLKMIANYEGARPYYERSLEINEKVLGGEHPDTALSLNNLGALLRAMGDYEGAWPYFQRSLEIREKVLGGEHPDTAQSLNNLGFLLFRMGDYEGAQPYFQRSLAICEKVLGGEHPDTALSLNNLGLLLSRMGDYEGAQPYFQRSLEMREKVLGREHPHTARSLNNLGLLLSRMGDYEGAQPYFQKSLAICEKVLGGEHPDTARSLNNLGELLSRMGDYEGAWPYYERSLAIHEKSLGGEHPATATSLNNLGLLLSGMGSYKGAQLYFQRSLEIREKVLGGEHPHTTRSLNNLGLLLFRMGDYEGARSYYERALAIFEEKLGPDHPYTKGARDNLEELGGRE